MRYLRFLVVAAFIVGGTVYAGGCRVPGSIKSIAKSVSIEQLKSLSSDVRRNYRGLSKMCLNIVTLKEGRYNWRMLLVTNPKSPKGAFWFLPHDNENTAFDSAVYAVQRYVSLLNSFIQWTHHNKMIVVFYKADLFLD